jgi:hypothetical protein
MSLPYEKELEERLAAMQIQLDKKKAWNDELSAQLDELINCVYGFFTSDKRLFYAGQAANFGWRVRDTLKPWRANEIK